MQKITPCLWFDTEGEDAAKHYTSIFKNSLITEVAHYGDAGPREAGTVMTVTFELDGQEFLALNGGPDFTFNEAVSLQVYCDTQEEIDHFWTRLSEGGEEGPCGWLKDKFGVSWQVTPRLLNKMITASDQEAGQRAMNAMLGMKKLDISELQRAYDGG